MKRAGPETFYQRIRVDVTSQAEPDRKRFLVLDAVVGR